MSFCTPKLITWYLQQLTGLCIRLYSISSTLISVCSYVRNTVCNFVSNNRNMGRHKIWHNLPINHFLMLKMWSRQVNQYSRSIDTWIAQCTWCKTTLSKSTLQSSNKQTNIEATSLEIFLQGVIPHRCLSASQQLGNKVCSLFRQSSCSQAFQPLHTWTEDLASLGHHFCGDLTLVNHQLH